MRKIEVAIEAGVGRGCMGGLNTVGGSADETPTCKLSGGEQRNEAGGRRPEEGREEECKHSRVMAREQELLKRKEVVGAACQRRRLKGGRGAQ